MVKNQNKSVPKLRFKGFTDAWVQRRFGELYKKVTEKNDLSFGKDKIISVANMYFKNDESRSDNAYMRTYNIFRVGDIAFEGHSSKQFAYGRFVENTIGDGIVSHIFDVFRPISNYDLKYWKYAIINEQIMGRILMTSTTQSTMMNNLVSKDFLKSQLAVPSYEEQAKIGAFLESLDKLIAANQRKLESLKDEKKAYLERIFNQKLRFKGFTEPWVQRGLGDVVQKVKSYSLSRDVETEENTGFEYIHYGDIHTQKADVIDSDTQLPSIVPGDYDLIQAGDVIVADASEDYLGIAEPAVVVNTPTDNLVAGLHTIALRPNGIDPLFLYYLLHTQLFKHFGYRTGTGLKVFGISYPNLVKFTFSMPTVKEQEAIAKSLREIDNLIAANQQKIDLLQNQKKSYLQKMFV
jgi:Restriction endonuclease S subunits